MFSPNKIKPWIRTKVNPLSRRQGAFNQFTAVQMEPHRSEMETIAQNELKIPLDKLPNVYEQYFHRNIKSVYYGKLKKLVEYFDDLFELKWTQPNNKHYLISKIYTPRTHATRHETKQELRMPPVATYHEATQSPYTPRRAGTTSDYTNEEMERYRKEMEIIGTHQRRFHLSQLPNIYRRYFDRDLNSTKGARKCKNIALYFNDIFRLQRSPTNNATTLVSKIYQHRTAAMDSNPKPLIRSVNQTKHPPIQSSRPKQSCETPPRSNHPIIKPQPMEEMVTTTDTGSSNNAIEFERFWFIDVNVFSKSFGGYNSQFVKHKMNDIACLLDDEIETKLQNVIGVNASENLEIIMKHIHKLKHDNQSFIHILKDHKLDHMYPMFTDNAIYTVKALKRNIKSKEEIQSMIASYIPGSNDEALVLSIWNIKKKR
eukprot:82591_1